jgi:hypothetical protein
MSYEGELHDNYAGIRSRLMGVPRVVLPKAVRRCGPAIPLPPAPEAWGAPINFYAPPNAKFILRLVALRHGINVEAISGRSRFRSIVAARHEAIGLVYTHCRRLSLPEIGRLFNRDHTTILHAIEKLRKSGRTDMMPVYRSKFRPTSLDVVLS